jgi:hypothetical protein
MSIELRQSEIIAALICLIPFSLCGVDNCCADDSLVKIEISSLGAISGTAGDYIAIQGKITNMSDSSISDITTYLSLVDNIDKMPVDLEDWSAEKGLFIGSIDAHQVLPLNWRIHLVKSGTYSLILVADVADTETPAVSTIVHFQVNPKHNLNPGKVLPIALGEPFLILAILLMLSYWRSRKIEE